MKTGKYITSKTPQNILHFQVVIWNQLSMASPTNAGNFRGRSEITYVLFWQENYEKYSTIT
jgi:hypothetical protein